MFSKHGHYEITTRASTNTKVKYCYFVCVFVSVCLVESRESVCSYAMNLQVLII